MSSLHTCASCGASFDLDQVHFEEPRDDNSTQFGFLAGNCPECEHPLKLTLTELQAYLGPPPSSDD